MTEKTERVGKWVIVSAGTMLFLGYAYLMFSGPSQEERIRSQEKVVNRLGNVVYFTNKNVEDYQRESDRLKDIQSESPLGFLFYLLMGLVFIGGITGYGTAWWKDLCEKGRKGHRMWWN